MQDARSDQIVEALKAVRDKETCLDGLQALRALLRDPGRQAAAAALLGRMPDATELRAVWDTQLLMKDSRVATELLAAVAELLGHPAFSQQAPAAHDTPAERLAAGITAHRLRSLGHCLGSGNAPVAAAALRLLTAVAALGPGAAADLAQAFDFSLPAFSKAALPPRRPGADGEQPAAAAAEGPQAWAQRAPACAAFADFCLQLLRAADAALLSRLLRARQLWEGLLCHLSRQPPWQQRRILAAVQAALRSEAGSRLPPAARAEPFSDAALAQLARVAQQAGEPPEAGAALELLTALGTEPGLGLCPPPGEGEGSSAQAAAGRRSLLRLLQRLRPTESPAHFRLLVAVTRSSPHLASAALGSLQLGGEPRLSSQWLAGMAAVGRLVPAAAGLPSPLQRGQEGPPALDASSVRALLRRTLPPALSKAQLTRGCQSAQPLVRFAACCTLRVLLDAAAAALRDAGAAAAAAASPEARRAWRDFLRGLAGAVRARLPDVAALRGVLAALQPELALPQAGGGGAPLSAAQLCAVPLLAALQTYQAWLPGAAAEAGLDAGRLLAKEVERWPPVLQASLLRLLARTADSLAGSAPELPPSPPASLQSTEALETLLRLAAGGGRPAAAARSVAAAAIAAAVGCPRDSPELWLWLSRLPGQGHASPGALTAAAKFLAEAVVAVARRPQELYELVLEPVTASVMVTVTGSDTAAVTAPPTAPEPARFSLLAVAALSRALKVLRSDKMAVGSRAAIAAYVAGVLAATLQTQRQPARLARTLHRVLAAAAHAQAAEPPADSPAESPGDSPKKRKRRKGADAGPALSLPAAGRAIASLAQFLHSALGAHEAAVGAGRKKRRTSGQGSNPRAFEAGAATAVVLQPPDAEAEQLVGRLRAWLQGDGQEWGPGELAAALLCCSEPELQASLPIVLQRGGARALLPGAQCSGQLTAAALASGNSGSAAVWEACDAVQLAWAAAGCPSGLLERAELQQRLLQRLRAAPPPERLAACAALLFWGARQPQQQAAADQGSVLGLLERLLQGLAPADLAALRPELLPHPLLLRSFLAAPASRAQQAAGRLAGLLLRAPGGCAAAEAAPYVRRLADALAAALAGGPAAEAAAEVLPQLAALLPLLPPAALRGLLPAADRCAERLLLQSRGACAAAGALLPPLALALAQQQHCSPALAAAAARLARTSAGAKAALAASADALPASFWRATGAEAQQLLQACLGGSRLAEESARLAAALVAHALPCRLAYEALAVRLLVRAAEAGAGERREATALLLPSAAAFLQQPPAEQGLSLAAALRERLLAFVAAGGPAAGQGAQLSPAAEAALRSHALPVLLQCLRLAPLPQEQQTRAEKRLLPAAGWPCRGGAAAAAAAARAAALAAHLVQHRLAGEAGASAELLARYAAACMATLTQLTASSKQGPEEAALAAQLWSALDGWVGDSLAEQPRAACGPPAALLAGALLPLGTAVLQRSGASAGAVRSLRRLAAALLLPAAESEAEAELLPEAGARSPALAAAAARLLALLTSHPHLTSLISPQQGGAAAAAAGEFSSLLPAVEARQAPEPQAPAVRTELLELLEILLDLLRQHGSPDAAQQQQLGLGVLPARLLPCYGASLDPGDLAIYRILRQLAALLQPGAGEGPAAALAGPLAATDFLWGEAAAAAAADASGRQRQRLLACPDWVQLGRVAATVVHFPEARTLAGQEADPGSAAPQAAHDPAFLLLFCVHALKQPQQLRLEAFAASGLLPLCLRCLAAADPPLRALAFEATALCAARLRAEASGSFRGKSQLAALLGLAERSAPRAFARLPALAAAFLAEAALVLLQPGSPLYPPLCKLLAGSARLSLQEVPLMGKLLGSCSSDSHAAERTWLLQLLLAGARGELDAGICRKRFVAELLMSLHDSPLAGTHLQQLAAAFLCGRLQRLPGYAADLAARAGLVPWLAATACAAIAASSGRGRQTDAALQAIGALHALLEPADAPDEPPSDESSAGPPAAGAGGLLRDFRPALSALCDAAADASPQPAVLAALTRLLAAFLRASAAAGPPPQGWQPLQALPPAPSPQQVQQLLSAAAAAAGAGRLPADALGCLLAVDLQRAAEGPQQPPSPLLLQASALAQWLQRRQLPPANPAAGVRLLAWLGAAAEAGAALASDADSAAERQAAALRVLAAHDSLAPAHRRECAHAAAVALLHLLQPCVAAACGLPGPGEAAAVAEGGLGRPQSGGAGWVWLLGNTLPRLLDCAALPRLGPAGSAWPAGGLRAGAGPAGSPHAQAAATELLLLLLAQWLQHCDASLVWRTLLLWQAGACGPELAAIGRREARQAGEAGLDTGA